MIGTRTSLEVTTLGRFEVRREQEPLSGGNWNRRKVCELFKVLLSADQHRLHREQVQEMLWPSSTSEQAANSFGKTLYLLRRALEPELATGKGSTSTYVTLDHDTVMLVPDSMQIDADLFESAAKQLQIKMRNHTTKEHHEQSTLLDEFDAVLGLYGGDYLPEDLYEEWAQRRRDRLRRIYSWLLENAAELAVANAMGLRACEYLQALLEHNSADEQTHRQLMLIYARMGRRSEALNQYQLLREALREELRTNPLPETVELFRAIQAGRIAPDLAELHTRTITRPLSGSAEGDLHVHAHAKTDVHTPSGQGVGTDVPRPRGEVGSARQTTPMDAIHWSLPTTPEGSTVGTDVSRPPDPERILEAELVGRDEELQRLRYAATQSCNGQRRICFVSGEPGIGKTRLAHELTRWAEETQRATVLWGYCYEMSGSLPYQPIADAISAHIRTSSPEQLRRMLGNSAVDLAKITPELRSKLPDLPQSEPIGPEAERRNLYNAVATYFNALAAEHPLMIILDDIQWVDTATMQLLTYLTGQGLGSPSAGRAAPFYLLLYRAEEVHETHPLRGLLVSLTRMGSAEEVRLKRLKEDAVQQLLASMAGHSVRPTFTSEIYKHTEGNPFFVSEAIRSLVQEGKIQKVGERWQATVGLDELALPQNVRLLIERRLAHFSPECRTTLSVAAVLGRQFSSELLCRARNLSEDIVAEHVDEALRSHILMDEVQRTGGDGPAQQDVDLAFTHDKIREVLSQWLNPLRRRWAHRQVAQAIEARHATRLQPYYSKLAYHYQMAEDATQAVDYLLKAAQHAFNVYAFVDATAYMEKALDLLIGEEDRPHRAQLLLQLASGVYIYIGQPDKAVEAGIASFTLWRDLGNPAKEAEALLWVAFAFRWQGRESNSLSYIKRAVDILQTLPEEKGLLAKAYVQWATVATFMGDTPVALEKLRLVDELYEQVSGKDPFIPVVYFWARSWCAFLTESPLRMLEYAQRGAEVCRAMRMFGWEPMLIFSAAWAQMLLGRLVEGAQSARDALEKAQRHNAVGAQGWAHLTRAFLAIQEGNWDRARDFGDKALAIAQQLHNFDLQSRVLWSRSVCAGWRGAWEEAIRDILEALQLAHREGEISLVYPYLLMQAAKSHFHADKLEEAQFYLDQAMRLALDRHYAQLPAIGHRIQGRILQAQGKFDEAQSYFERSLAELAALDDIVEHARTLEAYGLFFLARNREGDHEHGAALLARARETFDRLGIKG